MSVDSQGSQPALQNTAQTKSEYFVQNIFEYKNVKLWPCQIVLHYYTIRFIQRR